jgi:cell division protein FtsB
MKKGTKIFLKIFFYTPVFLAIIAVFSIALFFSIGENLVKGYEMKGDITKLEDEVKRLEGRNKDLYSLIDFVNTNSFAEGEARLKLGLAKPGESVIVIPENNAINSQEKDKVNSTEEESNAKSWWNYFFKSVNN